MIEHEDLIAQHGEAIEVLRPLLMRDGRNGRLEPRDVRLERDRHLVAKAARDSRADDAQKPRRDAGDAEGDGAKSETRRVMRG